MLWPNDKFLFLEIRECAEGNLPEFWDLNTVLVAARGMTRGFHPRVGGSIFGGVSSSSEHTRRAHASLYPY